MKNHVIQVENREYELERNYRDAFREDEFKEKVTDYFDDFDYIFGDYSCDALRLKGFYDKNNKNVKKINSIERLEDYIKDYCSYECRYFLLKKIKK